MARAPVTIATERERYAQQLSGAHSGELFSARRAFNADFKDPVRARPADAESLGGGRGAEALDLHLSDPNVVYRGGATLASIVSGDCAPIYVLAPRM